MVESGLSTWPLQGFNQAQELALEYRRRAKAQKARDMQTIIVDAITNFAISPQGWPNDLASTRAGTFETTTTGTIQLKMNLNRRG